MRRVDNRAAAVVRDKTIGEGEVIRVSVEAPAPRSNQERNSIRAEHA